MGTTTGDSGTPLRRTLVWSHHTSYTGAAGVHTETGKKGDVIQLSGQRELNSSLSSLQTVHQKELRTLHQHRKSLENSMLAYTEKMRKISSERFQLAQVARTSREENVTEGSVDRILASSNSVSTIPNTTTRSRVSVDSGVEMVQNEPEGIRRTSSNKDVMAEASSSSPNIHKPRSVSLHALYDVRSTRPARDVARNAGQLSPSLSTRRRRAGTMEQPDIFSLKLSMQSKDGTDGQPSVDQQQNSPSSQDCSMPPLEIMPFPESKPSSEVSGAESDVLIRLHEDFDRASGTSSRTSQSSSKKLMKPKDNYWSFRNKSPHRLSLPLPQPAKKKSPPSESPRPAPPPRPLNRRRATPRRSNKTYHKSFRYSLAVDDVLQSLEESENSAVNRRQIRKVSDSLPSLDLHELRIVRQKLRQGTLRSQDTRDSHALPFNPSTHHEQHLGNKNDNAHRSSSAEESGNEDARGESREDGDDHSDHVHEESADEGWQDEEEEDVKEPGVSQERSLSTPDHLLHHQDMERGVEESGGHCDTTSLNV